MTQQPSPRLWAKLKPLARQKRREPTAAENRLWAYLRDRQAAGCKFRRQHPLGKFIVDFFCVEAHLIVEVDGSIHEYAAEEDAIRQEFLESLGLTVLRFTNDEALNSPGAVIAQIAAAALGNTKNPLSHVDLPSPPCGEGPGVR